VLKKENYMEKLYTVKEVAEYLRVSTRTIMNLIKNEHIKGVKIGNRWKFTETDIKNLIDKK